MGRALIIFGSGSDEPVFSKISASFKKAKIAHSTRVASAHRTPKTVEQIVSKKWDWIVAGAGVSAALPGVVSALSIRPVIGVPVDGSLGGLDAFLSIMQMPPGIPVLCTPPGLEGTKLLDKQSEFLKNLKNVPGANIIGDPKDEKVKKMVDALVELGIPVMYSTTLDSEAINIHVFKGTKPRIKQSSGKAFVINVPILKPSKPTDAIKLMKNSAGGFWTGIGRTDNALLLTVALLNTDGRYDKYLLDERKKGAAKVKKQDREASKYK